MRTGGGGLKKSCSPLAASSWPFYRTNHEPTQLRLCWPEEGEGETRDGSSGATIDRDKPTNGQERTHYLLPQGPNATANCAKREMVHRQLT